jgi:hypothetical protein
LRSNNQKRAKQRQAWLSRHLFSLIASPYCTG